MERGSDKHGPMIDDEMSDETESLTRADHKEARADESREKEPIEGEAISGSGSSADTYPLRDHGEEGGASHPKPQDRE